MALSEPVKQAIQARAQEVANEAWCLDCLKQGYEKFKADHPADSEAITQDEAALASQTSEVTAKLATLTEPLNKKDRPVVTDESKTSWLTAQRTDYAARAELHLYYSQNPAVGKAMLGSQEDDDTFSDVQAKTANLLNAMLQVFDAALNKKET